MKKGLKYLAILAALSITPINILAANVSIGTIQRADVGDTYTDAYEAPKLYVELEDAYTRAGKKEEFKIKLEDAIWCDGESTVITARDLEEILPDECNISVKDEKTALVTVDIPSDVTKEDKIGFKIPLRVQITGKSPVAEIQKTSDTKLVKETQFAIAVGEGKKASWEVNHVESFDQSEQIIMAPITFSEAMTGAISEQEFKVDLTLENQNFKFQIDDYKSVVENAVDMEYTVDSSKYLLYEGGFSGVSNDFIIKAYPNNPRKITLKLKGCVPSSIGKITFHNFPIVRVGDSSNEEDILLSIKGDEVIDEKEHVVVAYSIFRENPVGSSNQTVSNNAENTNNTIATANSKNEGNTQNTSEQLAQSSIQTEQRHVKFKINEPTYKVNDISYPMTAAPYLDGGYTMVPVRYVALAFGAEDKDIQAVNSQIEISVLGKHIILQKQSNIAVVDGKEVKMATNVKVNEGRVYVPIGEISEILGLNKSWDKVTQTVDFIK